VAVERGRIRLLDFLDGAALHKEALDRIKRRQLLVARLQGAHLAGDPEQLAEEILDIWRQIDEQVAFGLAVERLGLGAPRHQPRVQTDIGRREMRDKGAIEPDQPVALVKIGKTEPVFQGEIGHGCLLKQTARRKPPANRRDSTCGQRRRSRDFAVSSDFGVPRHASF